MSQIIISGDFSKPGNDDSKKQCKKKVQARAHKGAKGGLPKRGQEKAASSVTHSINSIINNMFL